MKIAVIGFGYWGEILVKSLLGLKNSYSYLCVVDIDTTKKKEARKYKLDFFKDANSALPRVESVIIATPEHTHYEIVKLCLLKKKQVLVEKPLSLKFRQAKELVDLSEKSSLTLMVDSTFLFDKSFLSIKEKIKKGEIGKLTRIDSFRFSPNISRPKDNVVSDLLPHDLSLFYSLFKKHPKKIKVDYQALKNKHWDNACVKLDYGATKTYSHLSWTAPNARREMIIYGSKGVFLWTKKDEFKDKISTFKYEKDSKLNLKDSMEIGDKDKTLQSVLTEFLGSINLKKEPKSSGRATLTQIKTLEKILDKI
ncbi:Gfo/Idh/MocA family oxidoreductase [Patescibacteria group bacterium]|nr:Gfo/Idh/MocA family oxidoreductase [Patescibacteria group bacterium]